MRLTEGLGLGSGEAPIRPNSGWRLSSRIEEHILKTSQDTQWLRTVCWFILGLSATYALIFLRRSDLTDDIAWILHLKGYALVIAMHAALIYAYHRVTNSIHLGPGVRKLKTKIPSENALPVRIHVLQQDSITGIDEGYMWIEDGTIFFKGIQTVFRINWDDVPPMSLWKNSDRPQLAKNRVPEIIPVPSLGHDLKVRFEVLDRFDDYGTRRRAAEFYSSYCRWLTDRPKGSLESLLPPSALHPAFIRKGFAKWEPVVGLALLAVLDVALAISLNLGVRYQGTSTGFAIIATTMYLGLAIWAGAQFRKTFRTEKLRTELAESDPFGRVGLDSSALPEK